LRKSLPRRIVSSIHCCVKYVVQCLCFYFFKVTALIEITPFAQLRQAGIAPESHILPVANPDEPKGRLIDVGLRDTSIYRT
jgi:hypothetical protein